MSIKQTLQNLPAVVYLPTRTQHAAYAAGSSLDGSLYGFYTLCHRRIGDEEVWCELDQRHFVAKGVLWREGQQWIAVRRCKQCQRIIDQNAVELAS